MGVFKNEIQININRVFGTQYTHTHTMCTFMQLKQLFPLIWIVCICMQRVRSGRVISIAVHRATRWMWSLFNVPDIYTWIPHMHKIMYLSMCSAMLPRPVSIFLNACLLAQHTHTPPVTTHPYDIQLGVRISRAIPCCFMLYTFVLRTHIWNIYRRPVGTTLARNISQLYHVLFGRVK